VKHRGRSTSWRVAIAAACMLVLQSIGSAFAIGSAGAHPQFDTFGNPICVTTVGGIHSGGPNGKNSRQPDCCTIGCSLSAQPTGMPMDSGWALVTPYACAPMVVRPWQSGPASLSTDGAVHPRAPPLRA
jgi:hypothetical protein